MLNPCVHLLMHLPCAAQGVEPGRLQERTVHRPIPHGTQLAARVVVTQPARSAAL